MRPFLMLPAVLLFLVCSCNDSKVETKPDATPPPPVTSKYSAAFNGSIDTLLKNYYAMTEAFVNWDSVGIIQTSRQVDNALKKVSIDEVKSNPQRASDLNLTLFKMQDAILGIGGFTDITAKRHQLDAFTQAFFTFLDKVEFDQKKIYLQECPMAFNDEEPGVWLSDKDTIHNPYLGLHHPRYKSAMLDCGSNKTSIDYTSTKK